MKKVTRKLALAVALYLASGCQTAGYAMSTSEIGYDGKDMFKVYYYGEEDEENPYAMAMFSAMTGSANEPLCYTLKDDIKAGLDYSFKEWAEIIGPGARNKKPVEYFVGTNDVQNASATSQSFSFGRYSFNPHYLRAALQDGTKIAQLGGVEGLNDGFVINSSAIGYGQIIIGQNISPDKGDGRYGFSAMPPTPVPQDMENTDLTAVMYHEIGHSLGISSNTGKGIMNDGTNVYFFLDANNARSFTSHLYDQKGYRAADNSVVIVNEELYNKLQNDAEAFQAFSQEVEEGNNILNGHSLFVVDERDAFTGRNGTVYLSFRGPNVTEALAGKTFTGANGEQISGIPINTWEGSPDFSHIELARGLMSHQMYRSYNSLMEAELALLQDIGYDIDRRNFYGRSIYRDGLTMTNEQGYSARNSAGTAYVPGYNTATYGVGLHVYGSNNHITQKGNIFARGDAAVGIRVDGLNDTITVPRGTEVHGDGTYGAGILVAYGKNHTINVDGTVTAKGKGGSGLWLDFGANPLGTASEYRGSYMRYKKEIGDDGSVTGYNVGLLEMTHPKDDYSFSDLSEGDLNDKIATINVTGTIEGGDGGAIYMAEEAFVDNINFNQGAQVKGDIINKWKDFDESTGIYATDNCKTRITAKGYTVYIGGLMLQYDGKMIPYNKYVPSLVTNLNFNADMDYGGNIIGSENTKIKVNNGTLRFGGTADVVNVEVAEEAAVLGGSFKVNDMSAKLAEGYADSTTGQFINHGTIGALSAESNQAITGRLVSDGTLCAYAGGSEGQISVTGEADISGSRVSVTNGLPDETWTVLKAGTITGTLANPAGQPAPVTGMLSAEGNVEGNTLQVTAHAANNLGPMTSQQAEAYEAVDAMQKNLIGDERRNELRGLYSMNSSGAKQALTELGSSGSASMASLVQQSTLASRVISDRLSTAFAMQPVEVTVPVSHLADSNDDAGLRVNMELPVAQDNNAWVKFTKNWGNLKGGADYHGSAISGGYDRRLNDSWRGGLFLSYQSMGMGAEASSGTIRDTRLGVYAGYHKNAVDAYLYADYGWARNKLRRSIGTLGLGAEANYHSRLAELGGEYKYDLHADDGKIWHVSPYASFQLSWLKQNAYSERGAGIFNQHVAGKRNTYIAGQLGVELKRYLHRGNYGMRLGVSHAFAGADPELSFRYEGYDGRAYTLRNNQDKTHFLCSLFGEAEFAKGWFLSGEAQLKKGAHDKDISAVVELRKVW